MRIEGFGLSQNLWPVERLSRLVPIHLQAQGGGLYGVDIIIRDQYAVTWCRRGVGCHGAPPWMATLAMTGWMTFVLEPGRGTQREVKCRLDAGRVKGRWAHDYYTLFPPWDMSLAGSQIS